MSKLLATVMALVFGMTFGGMSVAKAADQSAPIMVAEGKAGEDHGKAGEEHGKAGEDHGKAKGDQKKSKGKGKKKGHEKKEQ